MQEHTGKPLHAPDTLFGEDGLSAQRPLRKGQSTRRN
jgi:hypothetical protein